jgi:hypothetical protein
MLDRAKIIEVIPHCDFSLEIILSDQKNFLLDMKPFLSSPAYKKLANLAFFLSVKHDQQLIYWDEFHDMHIDQILHFSKERRKQSLSPASCIL